MGAITESPMRAFLSLLLLSLILNACATVDETPLTLDDEPSTSSPRTSSKPANSKSGNSKSSNKADKSDKTEKNEAGIVVNNADVELANRMTVAMDAFVFKNEKTEFTTLCKDKRFDCSVDEKRFPAGKKKTKRKVPPFMSGSKNGIQGDHRVQVKYDFYP
jgi:hypothetical protein